MTKMTINVPTAEPFLMKFGIMFLISSACGPMFATVALLLHNIKKNVPQQINAGIGLQAEWKCTRNGCALKLPLNLKQTETPTTSAWVFVMAAVFKTCKIITWDEYIKAHKKFDFRGNTLSMEDALI